MKILINTTAITMTMASKKEIIRKDIVTGESFPRHELLRLVKTPAGIELDPSGSKKGRGAYIKADEASLAKLSNGRLLSRAFHTQVSEKEATALVETIKNGSR